MKILYTGILSCWVILSIAQSSLQTVKDDFERAYVLLEDFDEKINTPLLFELIQELEKKIDSTNTSHWKVFYSAKMLYFEQTYQHERAIVYAKKILREHEKHRWLNEIELANIYRHMAKIYGTMHRSEDAILWANDAIRMIKDTLGEVPTIGDYYHTLGYIYHKKAARMKEVDEGKLELGEKHRPKGQKSERQKTFDLALDNFQKAVDYYAMDSISFELGLTKAYFDLAFVHENIGDLKTAKSYLVTIQKHRKLQSFEYFIPALIVLKETGNIQKALEHIQNGLLDACTTVNSLDIAENPSTDEAFAFQRDVTFLLRFKADLLTRWGRATKDVTLLEKGITTAKLTLSLYQRTLDALRGFEESKFDVNWRIIHTTNTMITNLYEWYQLAPSDEVFEELWEAIERQKAIQVIETMTHSLLLELHNREKHIIQSIQVASRALDMAMTKETMDSVVFYENALFEANQAMEKLLIEINKLEQEQFTSKYATIQQVQSQLKEDAVLITYSLDWMHSHDEEALYITTITSTDKSVHRIIAPTLPQDIRQLKELLQNPLLFQVQHQRSFINVSHRLYQKLIAPIEDQITDKKTLNIIVERDLFALSFELLLKNDKQQSFQDLDYLIRDFEVNYQYSATAYLHIKNRSTPHNQSLLAFAPVFDKGILASSHTSLSDLPFTEREVTTIAQMFETASKSATLLLRERATRFALHQNLTKQSFQFVHIATHGLIDYYDHRFSGLACYPSQASEIDFYYTNNIQFQTINADLVVLSSCESGIGQFWLGEGLLAFNRSFIYAGAKNVLFSLWRVSDKYSSQLMIDFYKNYFQGMSYTSALRQAKLQMLEDPISAQPIYWSGFVLMGE